MKTPDITKLLEHPTAIIGMTGTGKTFAAKGIVERLLSADRRVIIIDPTGAWYGLRAGADGSSKGGFPVLIFGGDHADIPLAPDAGKEIAEALAERHVQCILDVSDMTGGERSRFMAAFLETMFIKNRTHVHLIVDEADDICPQKPMPGQERMKGAFDKVVRKGRRRGFMPVMITQRPAVIDKSVLSQAGSMIILKLMSPQDQKAIKGWVEASSKATGEATQFMSSLSNLQRGQGWVWCPSEDIKTMMKFPAIKTFDSSRTPGIGEDLKAPALTEVDVKALKAAMAQFDAEAETTKIVVAPSKAELAVAEDRGFKRGFDEGYKKGVDFGTENGIQVGVALIEEGILELLESKRAKKSLEKVVVADKPKPVEKLVPKISPHSELSPALQRALDAVAWWHERGFVNVERKRAAVIAGLSPTASTFNVYVSKLKELDLVTDGENSGTIKLTPNGFSFAMSMPGVTALQAAADVLDGQARKVFSMVADAWPAAVPRTELADRMGLSRTASTLNVYIGKAVARGFIEASGKGMVRAADFIFEGTSK